MSIASRCVYSILLFMFMLMIAWSGVSAHFPHADTKEVSAAVFILTSSCWRTAMMRLFYSTQTLTDVDPFTLNSCAYIWCSIVLIFILSFPLTHSLSISFATTYIHRYHGTWQDLVSIDGRHFHVWCVYIV